MKIGVGIGLSYPKYATFVNRGGQTSPFHPSLVDYWNFKGKSNSDKDRNTIKGIKGELLTAYNFGWRLGSGYGLFKENYLTYNKNQNALSQNVTIQQIPEYEGAIVTDGIDDYLKLDKVGYKIGTVIVKYVPIKFNVGWNTVFDNNRYDTPNRNYLGYSSTIENRDTTMFVSNYGDYLALYHNTPKQANDSLYISSSYTESFTAKDFFSMALYDIAIYQDVLTAEEIQKEINVMEYGTPNPVFALNFDNFAYKAVDYPEFATGKVTTNKFVVDSTTETFNGAIAVAMNPEADTGEPIEVPSYKIKVTGLNQYSVGEGNLAVGLMGMMIDSTKGPWTYPISKDGVYDIPAISLSDGICNLGIMAQIAIDKPIEIEVLYDKNITKSFPETK